MEKKQKTGIETEGVLNGMKPTDTLTKKQLEEITGYSDNTISKIIDVSGLSTSARTYTVAELLDRFVPARKLLDAGKSYEEVKAMLAPSVAAQTANKGDMSDSDRYSAAMDQIENYVAGELFSRVDERVGVIFQYIPEMVEAALTQRVERGELTERLKARASNHKKRTQSLPPAEGSCPYNFLSPQKSAATLHVLPPAATAEES